MKPQTSRFLYSIAVSITILLIGTLNLHAQWVAKNKGLTSLKVTALAVDGSNLFAGTSDSGVFHSTDNGENWISANIGLPSAAYVTSLAINGNSIYLGSFGGLFKSTDNGASWKKMDHGFGGSDAVYALITSGQKIYVASNCSTAPSTGNWINSAFTTQTGTFTVSFDATPSLSNMDAVVGISNSAQTAYSNFACIVLFDASGVIKARNGGSYAATTAITYAGGSTYHVREVINIAAHTYSVFITPPGGSELTLGSNFAFRTEQNTVSQLNNWGAAIDATVSSGTLSVCNFALGGPACTFGISPTSVSPSAAATTGSVAVTAGTGCSWTAAESLSWVSITSGATGTGNGTVNYSITANTGAARSGVITIAGQSFTINQAAPVSGSLLDFYMNETSSSFSFVGGTVGVTATVAAEGLGGSNCLKYSNFPDQWAKMPRIHYATPKDISAVLATDVLRISIDLSPTPSTYIVVVFNDNFAVTVNTPVIDNVAGFQTFDISLSAVRSSLGNTVNDIYFHAGDGFPAGATFKVDEIRFIRPSSGASSRARTAIENVSPEEPAFADKVSVYPNPVKDEVKIELQEPLSVPAPLRITDGSGKTITESTLEVGTRSKVINTQGFAPGIYILHVRIPKGLIRKKIVIVHD